MKTKVISMSAALLTALAGCSESDGPITRHDAALCVQTAVHVSNLHKLPPERQEWVKQQKEFWIDYRRNRFPAPSAKEEGLDLRKINTYLYETYDRYSLEERNLKLFDALQACRDRVEAEKPAKS